MRLFPDSDAGSGFQPSRRALLKVGAVAGGGLLVGFLAPLGRAAGPGGSFAPNAFIRIDREGIVNLIVCENNKSVVSD